MSVRVWEPFLTESDRAHLAACAPKVPYGFGRRAAVLSVDNYRAAVGDRPEPLLKAIQTWPNSAGPAAWTALAHISTLLGAARTAGVPVIHVTGLAVEESGIAGWRARRGDRVGPARAPHDAAARERHRRRYDIVEQASPLPGEVVLKKTAPSAFFGTPLLAHLVSEGIDTLIVCGEAVSGCVRATVVDGCSNRLTVVVVEECVYDRHEATRAMNLFDIDQKYGDVIPLDEVLDWLSKQGHQHHHDQSHAEPDAHREAPPVVAPIPRVVLDALPAGAEPINSTSHPISGHVLAMAGHEIVDAVVAEMGSAFGQTPHIVLALRAEQVRDEPDLVRAIEQTGGGLLVVGVGYRPTAHSDRPSGPASGESCPECGASEADFVTESRPDGTEINLMVCDDCGAAWEFAI